MSDPGGGVPTLHIQTVADLGEGLPTLHTLTVPDPGREGVPTLHTETGGGLGKGYQHYICRLRLTQGVPTQHIHSG